MHCVHIDVRFANVSDEGSRVVCCLKCRPAERCTPSSGRASWSSGAPHCLQDAGWPLVAPSCRRGTHSHHATYAKASVPGKPSNYHIKTHKWQAGMEGRAPTRMDRTKAYRRMQPFRFGFTRLLTLGLSSLWCKPTENQALRNRMKQ